MTPRVLIALALAACVASEPADDGASTRDSAGITIVSSSEGVWPSGKSWRVVEPHVTQIGTAEGARQQQLFRVRGALRLDDGSILVANSGSGELRWYSPQGSPLRSAGGEGEGPGEFRSLTWIGRARGDSVYAWDSRLARLSVFDAAGRLVRDFGPAVPPSTSLPVMHDALDDGRVLFSRGPVWFSDSGRIGVQRPVFSIVVLSPEGAPLDSLGPFADQAVLLRPGSEAGSGVRAEVPFGPTTLVSATDDEIFVADNADWEIRVYGSDGELRRIIRRIGQQLLAVRPEYIEAYRAERLARVPPITSIREGMRKLLEEVPSPTVMPAFRSMLADSEGNLWVEETRVPGDEQPVWSVFDAGGRMLGQIRTPVGLTIDEIGADYILGRAVDDLDVEYVRLYRLEKPR